jgi:hypothetical protein
MKKSKSQPKIDFPAFINRNRHWVTKVQTQKLRRKQAAEQASIEGATFHPKINAVT